MLRFRYEQQCQQSEFNRRHMLQPGLLGRSQHQSSALHGDWDRRVKRLKIDRSLKTDFMMYECGPNRKGPTRTFRVPTPSPSPPPSPPPRPKKKVTFRLPPPSPKDDSEGEYGKGQMPGSWPKPPKAGRVEKRGRKKKSCFDKMAEKAKSVFGW